MAQSSLTNDELEYMRGEIEALLPGSCNILSPTYSPDGMGGGTVTWGTVGTAIPCRLDAKDGNEGVIGQTLKPHHAYTLTIPHDQTIGVTYRVEYGSTTFSVISVDLEKSWPACRRIYLERI